MKKDNPNNQLSLVTSQLETIEDYIKEGHLAIDAAKPLVVISWQLHLMYMDDEAKLARWPWRWLHSIGLVERDVRYRRLMKMVSIYSNLMRGSLQAEYESRLALFEGIKGAEAQARASALYGVYDGPLHFIVSDTEGKPLLFGTYDHDRIAFAAADDNEEEQ